MKIDLLTTVEYGGCSAKLSAKALQEALKVLPKIKDDRCLVDIDTHDDAGVYKINDSTAIIQTVDFFPPVCSDPYDFGQIAAANALSDVYAMGGQVLTAMNIVLFPSTKLPLEILKEILLGGQEKVVESGGIIIGGHTIDDSPPKYGLSVTGTIHPDAIITNAKAQVGDLLILTKPIGTGVTIAGKRVELTGSELYENVINSMKQLNKAGSEIMQKYKIKSATDITGFGLLGHAFKMASASGVTFQIESSKIPLFKGVYELLDQGCIPGACFRNLDLIENGCMFDNQLDYNLKMALLDPQTSGGLLICVPEKKSLEILNELKLAGYEYTSIIGRVVSKHEDNSIIVN